MGGTEDATACPVSPPPPSLNGSNGMPEIAPTSPPISPPPPSIGVVLGSERRVYPQGIEASPEGLRVGWVCVKIEDGGMCEEGGLYIEAGWEG